MEACFILIANRRVLVEAVQQFRDQPDEEKIHRGDYQETCFVAHTWKFSIYSATQTPRLLTNALAALQPACLILRHCGLILRHFRMPDGQGIRTDEHRPHGRLARQIKPQSD